MAEKVVHVATYTNGLVGPSLARLGPVEDGGTIVAETAPGCWGPMITPKFKGGHEVTQPVTVAGAQIGDAIALRIKKIKVTSKASCAGTHNVVEGRFTGDPFVARKCPQCGTVSPPTELKGIGESAIRCQKCGAEVIPFSMPSGYTMLFDEERTLGITVSKAAAKRIAQKPGEYAALPAQSAQHSVLVLAKADIAGLLTRLRPFPGNIGTTPAIDMPDSHNCGDFGQFLVGAPHEYGIKQEQLSLRTDGHMDIDSVREGSILICPVKVPGGGIYVGDMHAMQGDGEIAVHTTDVSGEVTLGVEVIKGLTIDGPILLPLVEDLPFLAKPYTGEEREKASRLARRGNAKLQQVVPIQVIGSGADLNAAAQNGLERTAALLEESLDEVKNRVTITGAVEIGRLPGVVTISILAPLQQLAKRGIAHLVKEQYGLS